MSAFWSFVANKKVQDVWLKHLKFCALFLLSLEPPVRRSLFVMWALAWTTVHTAPSRPAYPKWACKLQARVDPCAVLVMSLLGVWLDLKWVCFVSLQAEARTARPRREEDTLGDTIPTTAKCLNEVRRRTCWSDSLDIFCLKNNPIS